MAPYQQTINKRLVERVRKKVLKAYNELVLDLSINSDIQITAALSDDELRQLVLLALREARQPVSWREMKLIFQGIAGEDRLRKILSHLKATNTIAELTKTRFALPEYVPPEEIGKVKNPGILSKITKAHAAR